MNLLLIVLICYFGINTLITIGLAIILDREYRLLIYLAPLYGLPMVLIGLTGWFLEEIIKV